MFRCLLHLHLVILWPVQLLHLLTVGNSNAADSIWEVRKKPRETKRQTLLPPMTSPPPPYTHTHTHTHGSTDKGTEVGVEEGGGEEASHHHKKHKHRKHRNREEEGTTHRKKHKHKSRHSQKTDGEQSQGNYDLI